MPDVREVYEMVTKQKPPEPGALERQRTRQVRTARNRKFGAFAAVAAIVAIAVFAVVRLAPGDGDPPVPADSGNPSPEGPTVITKWYLDIVSGERTPVAADLSLARLPEVSPNGEAVAYNTCCDDDAIFVEKLDGSGDAEMITPEELDGYAPTWIDNDTILFQGRPERTNELGNLYLADVTTGEMTMVVDLPDREHGAWIVISDVSPDGSTVLYHLPRGGGPNSEYDLWTAPLAGGEPTLLREDAGYAQYGPDGSIVFLDHPFPFAGYEIRIMDGDGSHPRLLVGTYFIESFSGSAYSWPRFSPDGTKVAFGTEGGKAAVFDIATGEITETDENSEQPAWYGNDKLIVFPKL